MEGRPGRSFTEDYKRPCAELVVSSGRSVTAVAKELGMRDSVLRRWVEQFEPQPTSAARRPTTQATQARTGSGPKSSFHLRPLVGSGMSPSVHKQTLTQLFDHLVGNGEQ
jgi:transposase-like protein